MPNFEIPRPEKIVVPPDAPLLNRRVALEVEEMRLRILFEEEPHASIELEKEARVALKEVNDLMNASTDPRWIKRITLLKEKFERLILKLTK